MGTGCAGALELCFSVLCEAGSNMIVPSPGYSLYNCLAGALQVHLKYYNLLVRGELLQAQILIHHIPLYTG